MTSTFNTIRLRDPVPTEPLVDLIINVLQSAVDGLIEGTLVDEEGSLLPLTCLNPGHCAIGELLWATGWNNRRLLDLSASLNDRSDADLKALDDLQHAYGIHDKNVTWILGANDGAYDPEQSRYFETCHVPLWGDDKVRVDPTWLKELLAVAKTRACLIIARLSSTPVENWC